ncbi:reverse transcriptase family protein [Pseudomonas aeruginosa]|uniref:reverse transcriptase family protein n=1 Tax=Pseudomonas aeruginosa TaxID=287 RepID=UPI001AE0BAD1|nr:reverse transcriptase family protein [Pseudomonas aeruginosa]EKU9565753.1 RNA-directed DNA polymerase [Pseudomonas aeruginosa]MDF1652955.1 reverse transcriptase family protein [Pseudomonas aeruginosa]HCF4511736.1 RNA-directed DNA polymerase [Pseudomonas aeruginosa]
MEFEVYPILGIGSVEERAILSRIIADPPSFYRRFNIPKRRGGVRVIHSPFPSLANVQKSILTNVLADIPVSEYAFAYVSGRNAILHAKIHRESPELLKLDINRFFPSITRQMVFEALQSHGLSSKVSYFLSWLCTHKNELPQGACTSPVLSNIVFSTMDFRLSRLASEVGLSYSRYADDMAFSGGYVPRNLSRSISKILLEGGFYLNESKTQLKLAGSKKILVGVSISTGCLKAPKEFKRKLRAQIYELEKHSGNLSEVNDFDPLIYERVLGRINYLLQIEPDNRYALEKKRELSEMHQRFLSLGAGFSEVLNWM